MSIRPRIVFAAALASLAASCSASDGAAAPPPTDDVVTLQIAPRTPTMAAGATVAFIATATRRSGATATPTVTWSSSAGAITSNGSFTAPGTAGSLVVRGTIGTLRDSTTVTLSATPLAGGGGTLLLRKDFVADNLASRGWYDFGPWFYSADVPPGGGTRSLEWRWATGEVTPRSQPGARRQFAPADTL